MLERWRGDDMVDRGVAAGNVGDPRHAESPAPSALAAVTAPAAAPGVNVGVLPLAESPTTSAPAAESGPVCKAGSYRTDHINGFS